MAMVMNGEVQLAAPRELVWEKLNDTEALKASIPGCETLEKLSDNEFFTKFAAQFAPTEGEGDTAKVS